VHLLPVWLAGGVSRIHTADILIVFPSTDARQDGVPLRWYTAGRGPRGWSRVFLSLKSGAAGTLSVVLGRFVVAFQMRRYTRFQVAHCFTDW
jgi:hypothetical protein